MPEVRRRRGGTIGRVAVIVRRTIFGMLRQGMLCLWASPASVIGLVVGAAGLASGGRAARVGRTLEFEGGFVTWFLRTVARGAGAMTLGHIILGQSRDCLELSREHEGVHVGQYERWGPFFLPAYGLCAAWLALRGRSGYWDNPFERAAYDRRNEPPRPTDTPQV